MAKVFFTSYRIYVIFLVFSIILMNLLSPVFAEALEFWRVTSVGSSYIGFEKKNDADTFSCIRFTSKLKSTKQITESLSHEMHGFDLKPVPSLRGWQFSFITDRMCSGLVTKLSNGYEYIWLCGNAGAEEISELILISHQELDKK